MRNSVHVVTESGATLPSLLTSASLYVFYFAFLFHFFVFPFSCMKTTSELYVGLRLSLFSFFKEGNVWVHIFAVYITLFICISLSYSRVLIVLDFYQSVYLTRSLLWQFSRFVCPQVILFSFSLIIFCLIMDLLIIFSPKS